MSITTALAEVAAWLPLLPFIGLLWGILGLGLREMRKASHPERYRVKP